MSMRIDDGSNSPPDDDWFAPIEQETVTREDPARESGPEWEVADDWGLGDPASREVAYRHLGIVLAVIISVFLVLAGFLVGRITTDSTTTVVTITSTIETPASTTSVETAPATSTPAATTPAKTTPATTTPATPPASVPTEATLRPGTKGSSSVASLQAALTTLGYAAGAADGSYGPATVKAVSAFQAANNLTVDGVAGPATLAAINTALAKG